MSSWVGYMQTVVSKVSEQQDIASDLAIRDCQIEHLQAQLTEAITKKEKYKKELRAQYDTAMSPPKAPPTYTSRSRTVPYLPSKNPFLKKPCFFWGTDALRSDPAGPPPPYFSSQNSQHASLFSVIQNERKISHPIRRRGEGVPRSPARRCPLHPRRPRRHRHGPLSPPAPPRAASSVAVLGSHRTPLTRPRRHSSTPLHQPATTRGGRDAR